MRPLALVAKFADNMRMPLLAGNRTWLWAVYGLTFCGLFLGLPSTGTSQTSPLSDDYLIKTWDTVDSLAGSTVTAITQTPDGYLWVGTYEGLTRFDGVRSVLFDSQNTPELGRQSRIQGLYLDARGTLWINTYRGGLTSYRNGIFRREWPDQTAFDFHTTMVSSSSNHVTFVTQFGDVLEGALTSTNAIWTQLRPPRNVRPNFQCVDQDGTIWFLSRDGRIYRVLNGQYEALPGGAGFDGKRVTAMAADSEGHVWAGATNLIARWDGQRFEDMTPTNSNEPFEPMTIFPTAEGPIWVLANDRLREEAGRQWVSEPVQWRGLLGSAAGRTMGIHEDHAGGVWFNHYGNGVFYISPDGRFQRLTMEDGLPGDRVEAWFQDRDDGIWLGVNRGGLVRLSARHFQVIGTPEGLPQCPVLSVCQAADSTVWIGTTGGGLYSYKDHKLVNYEVGSVASANFVFSIFPQTNGDLWLSAGDGEDLFQFHDGQIERSPLGVHGVKSLLIDHGGRLWIGTKDNVGWYTATTRRVFATGDGVADSAVRALAEAPDGTIWSGADDGTLYHCGLTNVQAFQPKDALGPRQIWSVFVDSDGTVWVGTLRGGLLRFKDGQFVRFTAKQGLPTDVITQITEDRSGRLWLGTHQGICCVDKAALDACANGKAEMVDVIRQLNGLPSLHCSDGYQPACWRSDDGHLWFSTAKGVVSVDPDKLSTSSLPPPVVVEDLMVDGQTVPLNDEKVIIKPGHEQFEFRFTALNFDAPDQARFRYRIIGLDDNWVESDTRRVADYGNLSPNHYRFQVIACNSDGIWNRTGASVDFIVLPHFYETRWFLISMGVLILTGVTVIVRTIATRKYRQALARLAQQHAIEKDRARIAKDIHDDIGAGLTQITLLSELARRESKQPTTQLERISDAARDLTRAMDEIVWAVDPQRDTLASLMDYISAYAEDFLRAAGVRCRMDFPAAVPATQIDAELRYNLFLALKESLNNIVKHAQASEVLLSLKLDAKSFTLTVEDNGHGFETNGEKNHASADRLNSGLGLPNLKKRLEAVGGRCVMQSSKGKGTRIEMIVSLNGSASTNGGVSPVVAIGADALNN
jgi:ligand-binding sensor domain-containing protein/signal transduction histidine kinase